MGELEDEQQGGERRLHSRADDRGGTDHRVGPRRCPWPELGPGETEGRPEHSPGAQHGGEQTSRGSAGQAQRRHERLEDRERDEQSEGADTEEGVVGHVLAVAEQLRKGDADQSQDRERDQRRGKCLEPGGAVMGDPRDETDVGDGEQPDDRAARSAHSSSVAVK